MKLKVTFYVIASLISALVIIFLGSGYFRESDEKLSEPVRNEASENTLPVEGNPKLTYEDNLPDTSQLPPKNKSDRKKVTKIESVEKTKPKVQLIAYYFHPTARCQTCLNIENFTKEVIETRFEKEVKGGMITFRALNIEDSVNEHYIEFYNLQFSSVILAKFVNKKQTKWKNLEHVWKFANDKEQFFKYASIEIRGYLKEKE
jgi:hypothetical protein